jgi:hypothetical protein
MKKLLLLIFAVAFAQLVSAQCLDFFISEYVEGWGNNKAIEIYNPTSNPKDLAGYTLNRYSNGSATPSETMTLSGIVAPYDVVVVVSGQHDSSWVATPSPGYWSPAVDSALYDMADLHSTGVYGNSSDPMYFNGNDAITLEKSGGSVIVDIFGKIGENPGVGWTLTGASGYWTKDHSLIRKHTIKQGVVSNPTTFDASLEYDSLAHCDDWSNLGLHTCDCNTNAVNEITINDDFFLFPNPAKQNFVIKATDFISNVEVYNMQGQLVFIQTNDERRGDMHVDLGSEHNGVFFVKVTFLNSHVVSRKIMIN